MTAVLAIGQGFLGRLLLRIFAAIGLALAGFAVALAIGLITFFKRRRVQRAVDRRFNRARYDADRVVAAFAARLKDAVDLEAVRDDLASVVHRALEPAHVSVWMSERN